MKTITQLVSLAAITLMVLGCARESTSDSSSVAEPAAHEPTVLVDVQEAEAPEVEVEAIVDEAVAGEIATTFSRNALPEDASEAIDMNFHQLYSQGKVKADVPLGAGLELAWGPDGKLRAPDNMMVIVQDDIKVGTTQLVKGDRLLRVDGQWSRESE